MPVRLIVLAFAISAVLFAQFSSLTTPADGSTLYFSTHLAEKNTSQPNYGKIFDIDSSGLHLLYSRAMETPDQGAICSNDAYDLTQVSASSAGGVLAVNGRRNCVCYLYEQAACAGTNPDAATIISGGQSRDYAGDVWLSRNGKLALQEIGVYFGNITPTFNVLGLATGEVSSAYPLPERQAGATVCATGRPLADNGTAVLTTNGLLVLSGGAIQTIPPPSGASTFADATIDASGKTILLTARNLQTNRSSLRIASPGVLTTDLFVSDGYLPSMTDDGRLVVYLSARTGRPQVYVIGIDGDGDHVLTNEPDGLAEAIISGDGTTVYALTVGGRLLKISAVSSKVQELVPRTPYLTAPAPPLARGGRTIITGGGLSTGIFSAVPPLPESLGGLRVAVGGIPAPLLNVTPISVDFLVPLDARQGDISLQMDSPPSPFETPLALQSSVADTAPQILQTIHEDWSQQVSYDSPAHPGEMLHTYGFGLGATAPAVPFGQVAPTSEPLARVTPPLNCLALTGLLPPYVQAPAIEVSYAGLAPGMVGAYQVNWRVPAGAAQYDHINAWCISTTNPLHPFGWQIVVPVAPTP